MFSRPGAASLAFSPRGGFVNVFPSPLSFGRRPYLVPAALARAGAVSSSTHTLHTRGWPAVGGCAATSSIARSPPTPPSASLSLQLWLHVSPPGFLFCSFSFFSLFPSFLPVLTASVFLPLDFCRILSSRVFISLCVSVSISVSLLLGVSEYLFGMTVSLSLSVSF